MSKHSRVLTLFLAIFFVLVVAGIAQQQTEEKLTCPVSGKEFKKTDASPSYTHEGKTYYFCCAGCVEKFKENPEKYTQKKTEMKEVYTCPMHSEVKADKPGKCPTCGMKLEKKKMAMEHMHGEEGEKEHIHAEKEEQECEMHEKAEGKSCCAMMGMMSSEDVEMNVENLIDGIAVKITSKNADVVKKIQEMAAKMKAMCEEKETQKEKVKK